MIYTDPRLSPVLDTNGIVGAGSTEPGGEFPDSIGPGLSSSPSLTASRSSWTRTATSLADSNPKLSKTQWVETPS